jgi:hypothetical protein
VIESEGEGMLFGRVSTNKIMDPALLRAELRHQERQKELFKRLAFQRENRERKARAEKKKGTGMFNLTREGTTAAFRRKMRGRYTTVKEATGKSGS